MFSCNGTVMYSFIHSIIIKIHLKLRLDFHVKLWYKFKTELLTDWLLKFN